MNSSAGTEPATRDDVSRGPRKNRGAEGFPEPDLFSYAATLGMVRKSNPETSVKAAERILVCRTKLHEKILVLLKASGLMTDEELENHPEISWGQYAPSTVRKRRSELYQAGFIEQCGEKENSRGFKMTLWRVGQ